MAVHFGWGRELGEVADDGARHHETEKQQGQNDMRGVRGGGGSVGSSVFLPFIGPIGVGGGAFKLFVRVVKCGCGRKPTASYT